MGYTHYFPQQRAFTDLEWSVITNDAILTIAHCATQRNVQVQFESDLSDDPQVDDTTIRFNGVGDFGHETFHITKELNSEFNFCKTANKPYDLVVCMILLAVQEIAPDALNISSDGRWSGEWSDARTEYEKLVSELAPCPDALKDGTEQEAEGEAFNKAQEDEEITITVEYQNKVTEHWVSDIKIPKSIQNDKDAIRKFIQENEWELHNQNLEKSYTEESLIDLDVG